MRSMLTIGVVSILWLSPWDPSVSQASPGMRLEGTLTSAAGELVNGLTGVTVRIYPVSTGGSPVYSETFQVMVVNGALDLLLGSGLGTTSDDLALAFAPGAGGSGTLDRFLTLQVDGDPFELLPRRRITAGAFAMYALNAQRLGDRPASAYATLADLAGYALLNPPGGQSFGGSTTFSAGSSVAFAAPPGTPPFQVSSTTMVQNLNVEFLAGQPATFYTNASNLSSGSVSPARGGLGGDISGAPTGAILRATGPDTWAPLPPGADNQVLKIIGGMPAWGTDETTAGGGACTSCSDAAALGGVGATSYARLDVSSTFTGQPTFSATVPFLVGNSNPATSRVANLNADYLDGLDSSAFAPASHTHDYSQISGTANVCTLDTEQTVSAAKTFSAAPSFTASSGPPFAVTSSVLVSNLNAERLNGQLASFYQNPANLSGAVPVDKGGTGQTQSLNQHGVIFASSPTSMASTTAGNAGEFLRSSGGSAAPAFAPLSANDAPFALQKNVPDSSTASPGASGYLYQFTQSGTSAATGERAVLRLVDSTTTPGANDFLLLARQGGVNRFAVSSTGNVSAASFAGNGSGLTSLSPAAIAAGTISSAISFGTGSSLTVAASTTTTFHNIPSFASTAAGQPPFTVTSTTPVPGLSSEFASQASVANVAQSANTAESATVAQALSGQMSGATISDGCKDVVSPCPECSTNSCDLSKNATLEGANWVWIAVFKTPAVFGELEVAVGPTVRCQNQENTATFRLDLGIQKREGTMPTPDDAKAVYFGSATVTASPSDNYLEPLRGHPVLSGRVNTRTSPRIALDTNHFLFVKATYLSGGLVENTCFFFESPVTLRFLPEVLNTNIDPR
jgi:hypothetical protein